MSGFLALMDKTGGSLNFALENNCHNVPPGPDHLVL